MSMPVGGDKPWFCASYCDEFILSDNFTCPCLWVGTSLGSVLVIVMNLFFQIILHVHTCGLGQALVLC